MNREKESQLPMMQVNFIDSICLPIYEVKLHLNNINSKLRYTLDSDMVLISAKSMKNLTNIVFIQQAFAVLSDKLEPLVDGVRANKSQWLELAQNVQNKPNHENSDAKATNINNNSIFNRSAIHNDETNNGSISEIPKIVGKLGRLESHNYFQFKQNGSICDALARDHSTEDEAMDQ